MSAESARPILVTGSHRSGTTWVGHVLASPLGVRYVREPFNVNSAPGICRARFTRWFTYVCGENERLYRDAVADAIRGRYDPLVPARRANSPADVMRLVRDCAVSVAHRFFGSRTLLKDPIALLSAEWLASRFGMDVVVVIRHPAGFASSLKRLGWNFPFGDLLEQPLLMRDLLGPFRSEIEDYAERPRDIIDQAALLWRILHRVIAGYRTRHPEWTFVRLEDLARDPLAAFEPLFARLGLTFTRRARRRILRTSRPANPGETPEPSLVARDSRAVATIWKKRLTPAEVRRVREGVGEVGGLFYSDAEWG